MRFKSHIPNLLTLCNLLCGCAGIVFVLENRTIPAAYFVWLAALFDFADGFAARLLKVSSPIGKELDSLADVISFGVLPSVAFYKMGYPLPAPLPYTAFMIAAFSAIRLAVFNIDTSQSDSFKGLPTPANALFITSLPLLPSGITGWLSQAFPFVLICILSSVLLVSRIELFALKFKNFSWKENRIRFTFLALSVLLLAVLKISAIPLIILLYIVVSLIVHKSESGN
ncbi:MAG: CDP-diacylglycerol--serine O-phosphatidyltransferase [Cyclobacteriaceae bacterium]|nr:CDP-diacylglycerol--serine O-phosphatidyltransferase [Cyclobacteriaceae bacterium]MCX7637493.1 CDP-diacylglycerol--serine O-phosphatidyltransferase [Cyclobacteriaceae bacterium]